MIFLKRYRNYLITHIITRDLFSIQKSSLINDLFIGFHLMAQTIGITYCYRSIMMHITYLLPHWNLYISGVLNIHHIELIIKRRERVMCYITETEANEQRSEISFLFKYNKYSPKANKNLLGIECKRIYDSKVCLCGKHDKSSRCLIL
jgi:hypothetical protein